MTLRTGSKPLRPGFTLIELALTSILIVVLIMLSTATFRRTLSNLVLKDSAFNISNLITYAQETAIVERKRLKLKLNFENRTYRLMVAASPQDKEIPGRFGRIYRLPRGVSIEGSRKEIVFYPDGTADKADIYVNTAMKDRYKIAVKGFSRNKVEVTEEASVGK